VNVSYLILHSGILGVGSKFGLDIMTFLGREMYDEGYKVGRGHHINRKSEPESKFLSTSLWRIS